MRAVITRVNEASVTIGGQETARIGKGFLVLLGVHVSDTEAEADRIVDRICGLRVFEDANGKMNVNPTDAGAELLIVSQFTLFAGHMRAAVRAERALWKRLFHLYSFLSFVLKNRLCRCKTQQSHSFWIYSILAPLLYIGNRKKRYFHNFLTEYGHAHLFVSFTACVARTK